MRQQREFVPVLVEEKWELRYELPELSPEAQELVPYLGEMIRVAAYVILGIGLLMMIALVLRYVRLPTRRTAEKPVPLSVRTGAMLLDDSEPLPTDLAAQAWALWSTGRHSEALSLLYRGALTDLVAAGLRIEEGATEGDCLRQVRAAGLTPEKIRFFSELTRTWVALAYARRTPTTAQAEDLCTRWDQHFEVAS